MTTTITEPMFIRYEIGGARVANAEALFAKLAAHFADEDLTREELVRAAVWADVRGARAEDVDLDLEELRQSEEERFAGSGRPEEWLEEYLSETDAHIIDGLPNYYVVDYLAMWNASFRYDFTAWLVIASPNEDHPLSDAEVVFETFIWRDEI